MFKGGKKTKKDLMGYIKKNPTKDVTDWCRTNMPCPDDDRPIITVLEFTGSPPRMTTRDVSAFGVMPFSFEGKDLSQVVLEYLDMRKYTLDPIQKSALVMRDVNFSKATLTSTSFRGSTLARVSFERANMELAVLNSCVLVSCNFCGAQMRKTSLVGAQADKAEFREVNAPASNFMHANLEYADLHDSWFCSKEYYESSKEDKVTKIEFTLGMWTAAQFNNARLKGADFRNSKLCGVDFSGANLSCAMFQGADLRWCNFSGTKLCGANFSKANLTGARNLDKADLTWAIVLGGITTDIDLSAHKDSAKILFSKESVEKWAKELTDVNFSYTDLSDFDLTQSKLLGCVFRGAILRHTVFNRAVLTGADFTNSELYGANLSNAVLNEAKFTNADMRYVNLSGVNLHMIKDALLEAKLLNQATCTIGEVPEELKQRGMVGKEDLGERQNTQIIAETDKAVKEQRKFELEEEKRKKEEETKAAQLEKLDQSIIQLTIPRVTPSDMALLRMRLLSGVLQERQQESFPRDPEEKEERWEVFSPCLAPFGTAVKNHAALKKVYFTLIGEETHDEGIAALWRRTKDLRAYKFGTLQELSLEAMMRHKGEWASWSEAVQAAVKAKPELAGSRRSTYVELLFKARTEEKVPEVPPPDSPRPTDSPKVDNSTDPKLFDNLSASTKDWLANTFPDSQKGPGSPGSPGQFRTAGFPSPTPGTPGMPGLPGVPNWLGTAGMPPGMVPGMRPGMVGATGIPGNSIFPGGMMPPTIPGISSPGITIPGMPNFTMPPMPGIPGMPGTGIPGMTGGMPTGMPGMPGTIPGMPGGMPTGMPGTIPGMGMPGTMPGMPPGTGMMAPRPGMVPGQPGVGVGRPAMGTGQPRVKCVECGTVMEANFIAYHKRECRMRIVSCSQCKYSMRYIQWDTHNQYCNTVGTCPFCQKNVKDNLIVHMYEKHTPELMERNFFKGVEPPQKMR